MFNTVQIIKKGLVGRFFKYPAQIGETKILSLLMQTFLTLSALQILLTPTTASAVASLAYLERNAPRLAGDIFEKYGEIINVAALLHDYDPHLITALIIVESEGRKDAISHKGAIGLMQLMPATARALGVKDPTDPFQNILAGAKYLRDLERNYGFTSTNEALVAYNMGPTRARRWLSEYNPESYVYVERVAYVKRLLDELHVGQKFTQAKTLQVVQVKTTNYNQVVQAMPIALRPSSISLDNLPALLLPPRRTSVSVD